MTFKGPTGGQEAIRIFNQYVKPQIERLRPNGLFAKFKRKLKHVHVIYKHHAVTDRDRESLKRLLERKCKEALRRAKLKATVIIKPSQRVVRIEVNDITDLPDDTKTEK